MSGPTMDRQFGFILDRLKPPDQRFGPSGALPADDAGTDAAYEANNTHPIVKRKDIFAFLNTGDRRGIDKGL